MKILVDIGHPGHVHYFKNVIKLLEKSGHQFLVIARNKEVTYKLLDYYQIEYKKRGRGGKGFFGKLAYILVADFIILKHALKFKPDIFLSFSSTYAGHVSFLTRKTHILLDDTEHAKFEHFMYKPFANVILTPSCFYKDMGKKQIKFESYMELFYLHPDYFKPDNEILKKLNVRDNEKYAIIRFVSWGAGHDVGYKGFSHAYKINFVKELSKIIRVFVSSESSLPKDIEEYRITFPPEKLHDAIYYSSIYIGEGATTASEAAILGKPTVYINSLPLMGYLKDEQEKNLLFHFKDESGLLEKVIELIQTPQLSEIFTKRRTELLLNKINPTAFLVWFLESYPESLKTMKANPDYQLRFRSV
jgi:uncharacterized protein